MIKVGILGMGMMGWFHAARYASLPDVKLVAIADSTPARLEAKEAVSGNIADDASGEGLASSGALCRCQRADRRGRGGRGGRLPAHLSARPVRDRGPGGGAARAVRKADGAPRGGCGPDDMPPRVRRTAS